MKYFEKLDIAVPDLPIDDIEFHHNQICLNTVAGSDDPTVGTNSLIYDWDRATEVNGKLDVPLRDNPLDESDFTELCSQFKNTVWETVYRELESRYHIGRVRLMRSKPKTCLSWHCDTSKRIHLPIRTQPGCMMVIQDEVLHLEQGQWYMTNTLPEHTAFNASKADRIHLVVVVLDENKI